MFRPCIDLHAGKVKQIVGSTLAEDRDPEVNYESEQPPSYFADLYRQDGLSGAHVIMLGPGNEEAALEALRAFPGGLQVGGGITPDNAGTYVYEGASHVIVTSYVFRDGRIDWERLRAMQDAVDRSKLVLDLSCRKRGGGSSGGGSTGGSREGGSGEGGSGKDAYYVVTDRWQKFTDEKVGPALLETLAPECAEFLVHAVDVEGKQQGIDESLVRMLGEASPIPVTYAGGATQAEDLERVFELGRGRVGLTIGSGLDLFGGNISYRRVVEIHHALTGRAGR